MNSSIKAKLENIAERLEEINALMADPDVISDQNQFRSLSKEYAQVNPVVACFHAFQVTVNDIEEAKVMLKDDDDDMREMAKDELKTATEKQQQLEEELQVLMLPVDPNEGKNVFLEIRAGAGGDEASIFAGDLFRMYSRYAEKRKWKVEIVNENRGEHGGYKEIIVRVMGDDVYARLKFESGGHRVQRVPETESQGRVHTSACTVAIMPEADAVEDNDLNMGDIRVDTFRASGAGGQHVNKTDSAIRLTHLPTGIEVECQDQRSQHKNKAQALSVLQAKIFQIEQDKQHAEQSETRKSLVGSGDRSERIRTYNFPQGRLSDHRINLTLYKLDDIMQGELNEVIEPLIREEQADLLAAMGD